ncbi:bifunctional oligoribonuclease/PAP phosphatase NrnA [Pseudomonas sp. NPDC096950]|uniref:DHH family phosphoesterase n=1 Tax=Pseudomonas sp. NPDC096950 TaxID=3364485 RepID=UPI00383ADAC8
MKVVTSGSAYLDIDAYACAIAYAELLNLQGVAARAVSSATPNASVSKSVLEWPVTLDNYAPEVSDEFVLVDVSDFEHFDPLVVLDRVVEVIDHHPGFEKFWTQKLGHAADIRRIGAAATQVFERWEMSGLLANISEQSAALLATAILDNTMNFTGQLVTEADVRAYGTLRRYAKLPVDWSEQYFQECQAMIQSDLAAALAADMKRMKPETGLPHVFAQMTVWDAQALIQQHRQTISEWLAVQGDDWLLNVISISERRSYFLVEPLISQKKLGDLLRVDCQDGLVVHERSLLRKELVAMGLAVSSSA